MASLHLPYTQQVQEHLQAIFDLLQTRREFFHIMPWSNLQSIFQNYSTNLLYLICFCLISFWLKVNNFLNPSLIVYKMISLNATFKSEHR